MPSLLIDPRGSITILTLNRPERRNALSAELAEAIILVMNDIERSKSCRAVIFTGAGDGFCAGLDLKEAQRATEQEQIESAQRIARLFTAIRGSSKHTIAAVHGAARAGGAGIVAACDLALASSDATIGFPEVRRGLVPALVAALLRRQLSERAMRELFLLAEPVDATKALRLGLINRIVPGTAADTVKDAAIAVATTAIAGAPDAIAQTKRLLDDLQPRPFSEEIDRAIRSHEAARASDEASEGIAAFLERRLPRW